MFMVVNFMPSTFSTIAVCRGSRSIYDHSVMVLPSGVGPYTPISDFDTRKLQDVSRPHLPQNYLLTPYVRISVVIGGLRSGGLQGLVGQAPALPLAANRFPVYDNILPKAV
jgi:hypothetical protein